MEKLDRVGLELEPELAGELKEGVELPLAALEDPVPLLPAEPLRPFLPFLPAAPF